MYMGTGTCTGTYHAYKLMSDSDTETSPSFDESFDNLSLHTPGPFIRGQYDRS